MALDGARWRQMARNGIVKSTGSPKSSLSVALDGIECH